MRFSFLFSCLFVCGLACFALLFAPSAGFSSETSETDDQLTIVETACNKACAEGRGDKAFCQAYCGCIRVNVQEKSKQSGIAGLLRGEQQQQRLIHHCSGETAVKFYAQSCRSTCKDVPKCDAYCGCLQDKITKNRKPSEIGAFFIQLGKNESSTVGKLKRYESLCMAK